MLTKKEGLSSIVDHLQINAGRWPTLSTCTKIKQSGGALWRHVPSAISKNCLLKLYRFMDSHSLILIKSTACVKLLFKDPGKARNAGVRQPDT